MKPTTRVQLLTVLEHLAHSTEQLAQAVERVAKAAVKRPNEHAPLDSATKQDSE
jgi:hypothetical protein